MYATIDEFRSQLGQAPSKHSPEYTAKMLHDVPESESVDRTVFLLQRVAGKRVLEFGASGPMHDGIVKAASACYGVDRTVANGVVAFDLDDIEAWEDEPDRPKLGPALPIFACDLIICGELLEHLSNPGWFLQRLKRQYAGVPVIITVPNAFAKAGRSHIERGVENVNRDHCAWYSYTTLHTLLDRVGYTIREFYWYGGPPYVAEGLIVVAD